MESDEKIKPASSLGKVRDDILLLLNKMHTEMDCLETIDGTGRSLQNLRGFTADIKTILLSFGERFTDEARSIESFQKISFSELYDEKVDISSIKGNAHGVYGKVDFKIFRGQKVAVKIQEVKGSQFKDEIRTLRTISHDNIISFRGWGTVVQKETKKGGKKVEEEKEYIFLVMEYLNQDLLKYVREQVSDDNPGLSSRITWEISRQIAQAMFYLHNLDIPVVHADLKPDNILLDTQPIIPKPKICDFGLARHKENEVIANADNPMGHKRYRPPQKEIEELNTMEDFMKCDVFMFGLVVVVMRTGKSPYPNDKTWALSSAGMSSPIKTVNGKSWLREVLLPDLPSTVLGDLVKKCCSNSEERPTFGDIMKNYFGEKTENPFNLAEKGEFFECGFLKDTQIFVADSIVQDSEEEEYKPTDTPTGYRREDLICFVEVDKKPYRDKPKREDLLVIYKEKYNDFRGKAKRKEIDDNPAIALTAFVTDRSGEDETQKIELRYKETTYCHHRAMREIWRSFEPNEKVQLLPCLSDVHPIYSTSFGLHVAILTNEGPGNTKKFVFTRRSNKPGMASPGSYTCGAVESCSVKDYLSEEKVKLYLDNRRKDEKMEEETDAESEGKDKKETEEERENRWKIENEETYVSLIDTAARGLEEELGLPLQGGDKDAITLNTVYLKFDNHEWGMCGFVDLTSEKIRKENQFSFEKLKAAFTAGPKDRFEHWQIYGVDFELRNMVEWIRENHDKLASSAKIVVVKVLQAFFGVAPVANAFAKKM